MQIKDVLFVSILLTVLSCGSFSAENTSELATETSAIKLTEIDYWKDYEISNAEYGTKTTVALKNGTRLMKTNALPNHPTGTFPNPGNPNKIAAQSRTYKIPIQPKLSGEAKWAREPGVALNGVKFEPETAERFVCKTGEVYRIEAFQELVDLGLDFNHAHVQPTGAYHYHGVPEGLVKLLDKGEDLIHVGFAHDGFPMYYSKSGMYKPSYQLAEETRTGDACSYRNPMQRMDKVLAESKPDGTFVSDWEYVEGLGALDECNGIALAGGYAYFVTDEYPYIGRCLKGEFKEEGRRGPPPGGPHRHGEGGHRHRH